MRKLKVQMNISLDNLWDRGMSKFSLDNLQAVDCVLHGRNTAEGFIPYWTDVANNPDDGEHQLGKRFLEIPHAVFSNTLLVSKWPNTEIIKGDIRQQIEMLKNRNGKEIIVYGGNSFVSSLIQHDLVDEVYLLTNPAMIGAGEPAFNPLKGYPKLKLVKCSPFDCGAALMCYAK
ncbi:MAG TPA: dihydrofolate reductase family protein [Cyclobacteriaceae bacterium]|nr:dihydrofolate reductase family protein [Cyclobacteriaceae bacterium]